MALYTLLDSEGMTVTLTTDAAEAPTSLDISNQSGKTWHFEFGHPNRQANRTFARDFAPGETLNVSLPPGLRNNCRYGDVGPIYGTWGPR